MAISRFNTEELNLIETVNNPMKNFYILGHNQNDKQIE